MIAKQAEGASEGRETRLINSNKDSWNKLDGILFWSDKCVMTHSD